MNTPLPNNVPVILRRVSSVHTIRDSANVLEGEILLGEQQRDFLLENQGLIPEMRGISRILFPAVVRESSNQIGLRIPLLERRRGKWERGWHSLSYDPHPKEGDAFALTELNPTNSDKEME